MRALRLLSLAAALVIPAAAAHAQVGVYVGPSIAYAAPTYGGGYYSRGYWANGPYGRYWVAPRPGWAAPVWGERRFHLRDWDQDRGRRWGRDRGWDRDRRW